MTTKDIQYVCSKCTKSFTTNRWKNNHEQTCNGILNNLECHGCHKIFRSKQNKHDHIKLRCKKINSLEESIEKERIAFALSVNNFGNEDTTYMKDPFILQKHMNAFKRGQPGDIVKLLYFNKDHPENHTIIYPNLQKKRCYTHCDGKFIVTDVSESCQKIIDQMVDIIISMTKSFITGEIDAEISNTVKVSTDANTIESMKEKKRAIEFIFRRYDAYEYIKFNANDHEDNMNDKKRNRLIKLFQKREIRNIKQCLYNETKKLSLKKRR
jgi:hypothetical protein